jgi:hypothetical protein
MEYAETAGSAGRPGLAWRADRLAIWVLGAGLLAGVMAWLVGEATVGFFQPKMVTMNTPAGRMTGASIQEVTRTDVKNAALAFAVQGACLGLALGLAGGLARGSVRAGAVAGLAGMILGGALAFGASVVMQPVYYRSIQMDQVDQDLGVPMLVHGSIWGAAGLAAGFAFGLGLGGGRSSIARAAAGGLLGALIAAFLFEAAGAMAFPKAATTRPLSLTPESRLMAKLMTSILSAAGIMSLVAGRSASRSSGPELAPPDPTARAPVA